MFQDAGKLVRLDVRQATGESVWCGEGSRHDEGGDGDSPFGKTVCSHHGTKRPRVKGPFGLSSRQMTMSRSNCECVDGASQPMIRTIV
jgi:hypothetical protein